MIRVIRYDDDEAEEDFICSVSAQVDVQAICLSKCSTTHCARGCFSVIVVFSVILQVSLLCFHDNPSPLKV